jgi:hypothetical protein
MTDRDVGRNFTVVDYAPSFDAWMRNNCNNLKTSARHQLIEQINNCEGKRCEQCKHGHFNPFNSEYLNKKGLVRKNQSTLELYKQLLHHHGIQTDAYGAITNDQGIHPDPNLMGYDEMNGVFCLCHGSPTNPIQGLSGNFDHEVLQTYFAICTRDTPYFHITKWEDGRIRYDGQVPPALQTLLGEASPIVPATQEAQDLSGLKPVPEFCRNLPMVYGFVCENETLTVYNHEEFPEVIKQWYETSVATLQPIEGQPPNTMQYRAEQMTNFRATKLDSTGSIVFTNSMTGEPIRSFTTVYDNTPEDLLEAFKRSNPGTSIFLREPPNEEGATIQLYNNGTTAYISEPPNDEETIQGFDGMQIA